VHVSVEIGKREVGRLDAARCRRRRRGTESPDAVRGICDGWLPKVLRERGEIDPPGARADPLLPGRNRSLLDCRTDRSALRGCATREVAQDFIVESSLSLSCPVASPMTLKSVA
jgi:hypothetical protein